MWKGARFMQVMVSRVRLLKTLGFLSGNESVWYRVLNDRQGLSGVGSRLL